MARYNSGIGINVNDGSVVENVSTHNHYGILGAGALVSKNAAQFNNTGSISGGWSTNDNICDYSGLC